jgi:hypothetical protein
MTIASERTRAVNLTSEFLIDLLNPKKTQRVPRDIRRRAGELLKHYPSQIDMEIVVEEGSGVFGDKSISNR